MSELGPLTVDKLKVIGQQIPFLKESPYKEPRFFKSRLGSALISPPTFKDGGVGDGQSGSAVEGSDTHRIYS